MQKPFSFSRPGLPLGSPQPHLSFSQDTTVMTGATNAYGLEPRVAIDRLAGSHPVVELGPPWPALMCREVLGAARAAAPLAGMGAACGSGSAAPGAASGPGRPSNSVMTNASNMTNGFASGLSSRLRDKAASMETRASSHIERHTGKRPDEWRAKAADLMTEFRSDWKGAVCKQMDAALASTDYDQLNRLLDSAGPSHAPGIEQGARVHG
ncbi:unnamed protein product [Prorocentrum cordatum]|uniref:Uncharacterized protein n=1 Tax=Prorocentrum cordatum TaxID=2364126 RepID=A0ABN9VXM1_9DINO|nr:unnamed protein product [Polarella glacialis]